MRRTNHCLWLLALLVGACESDSSNGDSDSDASIPSDAGAGGPDGSTAEPDASSGPGEDGGVSGPEVLTDDIQMSELLVPPTKAVRLAVDPSSDELFYMDLNGDIRRINVDSASVTLVHEGAEIVAQSGAECGVGAEDETAHSFQGFAIADDGTMYVVDNCINRTQRTNRGVVYRKGAGDWEIVMITDAYPDSNTPFDHHFNGVAISPDGDFLYVNSGSRTDHGEVQDNEGTFPDTREVPLTSAMFRIPADGAGIVLENDEAALEDYLFADGLRNSFDPTFGPDGELFSGENGPDADYVEELNWLREGEHYGFPWQLGDVDNPQQFDDYDPENDVFLQTEAGFFAIENGAYVNDPDFPVSPGGFTLPLANTGPDFDLYRTADGDLVDVSEEGDQLLGMTPHLSPLGLVFDLDEELSGAYAGRGFVIAFGAATGTVGTEHALAVLDLQRSGDSYTTSMTKIVDGFVKPIDAVLFGGKLYVADFGDWDPSPPGPIYELTFAEN